MNRVILLCLFFPLIQPFFTLSHDALYDVYLLEASSMSLGFTVTDDVSDADVMIGVKEVPVENLIPNKKYFYFSHTIKKQPYNRKLLKAMIPTSVQQPFQ